MKLIQQGRLTPLLDELRSSPRLQAGAAVICLLLLYGLWSSLDDWHRSSLQELGKVRSELERVEGLAGQEIWLERAEDAKLILASLNAEIPNAASAGLAQAAFQSWLSGLLASMPAKIQMNLEPGTRVDSDPGLIRIGATISGPLSTRQVLDLVKRIESERQLIVISAIQIRSERNDTFSLTAHAYYRLDALTDSGPGDRP